MRMSEIRFFFLLAHLSWVRESGGEVGVLGLRVGVKNNGDQARLNGARVKCSDNFSPLVEVCAVWSSTQTGK